MNQGSWMAAGEGEGTAAFPCLHASACGRVLHCAEFRRVVIEYRGTWLVLRTEEFLRLGTHIRRLAACGPTRSRLLAGERVRLRDAAGGESLLLDLAGLEELGLLMGMGESRLAAREVLPFREERQPVADTLGD